MNATSDDLQTQAQAIIDQREPIVQRHLEHWEACPEAQNLTAAPATPTWFIQLDRAVCAYASPSDSVQRNAVARWFREFLVPLAEELELVGHVEYLIVYDFVRHRRAPSFTEALDRAEEESRIAAIRHILHASAYTTQRIDALCTQQFCADTKTAELLIDDWRRCAQRAGALARGIVLTYLRYGYAYNKHKFPTACCFDRASLQ